MSRENIFLLTAISFAKNITLETTKDVMKTPLPTNAPIENSIPASLSPEATKLDIMSGAPFPNARKVTPARF